MRKEEARETTAVEQIEDLTVTQDQAEAAKGGDSMAINYTKVEIKYVAYEDK